METITPDKLPQIDSGEIRFLQEIDEEFHKVFRVAKKDLIKNKVKYIDVSSHC